jgi:hypothetical protein
MQSTPEPSVVEWLDQQPAESAWITGITLFEARLGPTLLPSGLSVSARNGVRAIAVARRVKLATGTTKHYIGHFADSSAEVVNPWEAERCSCSRFRLAQLVTRIDAAGWVNCASRRIISFIIK